MKNTDGYTQQLADFIVTAPRDEFPDRALELGKQHILDTLAVGIAGLKTDAGQYIRSYAEQVVTHQRLAVPVPEGMSDTDAAAIPEAFISAHDALVSQGRVLLRLGRDLRSWDRTIPGRR